MQKIAVMQKISDSVREGMSREERYHMMSELDQVFLCYPSQKVAHLSVHILCHGNKENHALQHG